MATIQSRAPFFPPAEQRTDPFGPPKTGAEGEPVKPRPDSLSGHLPAWVRSRSGTTATGATTQKIRVALSAFFAQATQTATYKFDNDDATFLERLSDGMIIAGLFDGVTIPKRDHRTGHALSAFIKERLRETLIEKDGRRPIVEEVLANAMQDSVGVLDRLGGGAATTATVLVALPMPNGDWRLYVINAGNSRATLFLPDGTLEPITRIKPPGTPFAAINTLSQGYLYKRETAKLTAPAGTIVLLTSDGIHDHVADMDVWFDLGRAVNATIEGPSEHLVERLTRAFVEGLVEHASEVHARVQRSDDTTAIALVLSDPTRELSQKRPDPNWTLSVSL